MTVSYSLSESLLEVTVEGDFTVEEAFAVFQQGLASIPTHEKPGVLIDVTRSAKLASFSELQRLAGLFGLHADSLGGRIGVLVEKPIRYGLARQFGAFVESHGLKVVPFENRETAVDWVHAAGPMTPRTWIDPNGQIWELSLVPPPGRAMAIGSLPNAKPPPALDDDPQLIRFTDSKNRDNHQSVRYKSDNPLSELSDEEIVGYWHQVVADHPELA